MAQDVASGEREAKTEVEGEALESTVEEALEEPVPVADCVAVTVSRVQLFTDCAPAAMLEYPAGQAICAMDEVGQ